MKTISKIEQEINRVRLKLYEETKDLTPEQNKARLDKITEAAARKYGYKIVASASDNQPSETHSSVVMD